MVEEEVFLPFIFVFEIKVVSLQLKTENCIRYVIN